MYLVGSTKVNLGKGKSIETLAGLLLFLLLSGFANRKTMKLSRLIDRLHDE